MTGQDENAKSLTLRFTNIIGDRFDQIQARISTLHEFVSGPEPPMENTVSKERAAGLVGLVEALDQKSRLMNETLDRILNVLGQ